MKRFEITVRLKSGEEHGVVYTRGLAMAEFDRQVREWRDGAKILTSHPNGESHPDFAWAVATAEIESIRFDVTEPT